MSAVLTVILRDPPRSFTEYRASVEDAADAVNDMATNLGAEIQAADLSTFGHQGWLMRHHHDAPIPISQIIGTYEIEELP